MFIGSHIDIIGNSKSSLIHEEYREEQEDQLNALGLATNAIVLWNTMYMQAAVDYYENILDKY